VSWWDSGCGKGVLRPDDLPLALAADQPQVALDERLDREIAEGAERGFFGGGHGRRGEG
jgi:hypothetical protein